MAEQKETWHLDKRVPLALIVTIFLQTAAAGWYISELNSRVSVLERDAERIRLSSLANANAVHALRESSVRQDEKLSSILDLVRGIDGRLQRMERGKFQQ